MVCNQNPGCDRQGGLRTPRPATGVLRALRARSVPGSVPAWECPRKRVCPTECAHRVFSEPGAQRARRHLAPVFGDTPTRDTPGALRARRARKTPVACRQAEFGKFCNNHKGGTVTGGYGFGYVSDMYPGPFWYVSDSLFDMENTEKDP